MVNRASFAEIVARVHTIPSLPEVVTEVCRLLGDPTSDIKQIHKLVVKDPAMAAKMLRMVNSVYYGLTEPVHDLEQALTILGYKTIRSIAMSISVVNVFQQQNTLFNMKAFWTHNSVCAGVCRLLARKANLCDPEMAFVIGLLKDIGKLVLFENAPDETRAIVAAARKFGYSFNRATREVIDTDDAEIGAWLCQSWGLDPKIVETIRYQYDIERAQEDKLVAMCQCAEYICRLQQIRVSGNYDESSLDPEIWHYIGLEKSKLVDVLLVVNEEANSARQLLQVVV